jgi:hypothetical protein
MKRFIIRTAPVLALALGLGITAAHAHRAWMLPSSTVLSGEDPWVTVDAAISNELFYFDHHPGRLTNLVITGPDGARVEGQNPHTGKYRSTFDVNLQARGTYRIALVNASLNASYTDAKGEAKRWRGTAERMKSEIPANAKDLRVSESHNRIETYVTAGAPTRGVFEPQGKGLELVPITHPNDLFAGETAQFRLLLEGKPAANLEVTIIRGGIRYRDAVAETTVSTGANGEFEVTWGEPGMYWLNASTGGRRAQGGPQSDGMAPTPSANSGEAPAKRCNYSLTLEILPQ